MLVPFAGVEVSSLVHSSMMTCSIWQVVGGVINDSRSRNVETLDAFFFVQYFLAPVEKRKSKCTCTDMNCNESF